MLTLSMIVKNEAAILANCLKSIRDWVDDIQIVDTGSTDGTIDIARENGASVSRFEWGDDFSAARNFARSLVRTPWTLWLDADDIALNPHLLANDCEMARRKRIAGLWCHYQQDESTQQRRLSVFKTKNFAWRGAVHESPVPHNPHLSETGYSEFTVLHRKPHARRPEAALKYLEILQAKDPENWFGLAESYRFLAVHPDDPENVATYRRNAEELYFRAAQYPRVDPATRFIALLYCGKLNLEIAGEDHNVERLQHAVRLLQLCHQLQPKRAEPITLLGLVYEALDELEQAANCYQEALALPAHSGVGLVLKDYCQAIPAARLDNLAAITNKRGKT